jgi:hypothetical protein
MEALSILSPAFCPLDGLSVLAASPKNRLGRTPMTVNGFYVPFGTLHMTVNVLNMTVNGFYILLGTLYLTVNFLNMTVKSLILGTLALPSHLS